MSLQKIRLSRGLSQSQLAEKSGIKLRTIQQYEIEQRNINGAKLEKLIKFATVLDCKITDLLTDETLIEECKKVTL